MAGGANRARDARGERRGGARRGLCSAVAVSATGRTRRRQRRRSERFGAAAAVLGGRAGVVAGRREVVTEPARLGGVQVDGERFA
jgi:hypothetical protein